MSKRTGDTVHRFGWDGNVVLHEWDIEEADRPKLVTDETGREEYDGTEKPDNLVTWVYDGTSFTPVAKVTDGERYTIVHDYLGTPTQAYDSKGELVWEMLLDVYGRVAECHGDRTLVPFRYQGQYEDEETGLYYNRFRYYSPEMGIYISSDPIGLAGNNPTLYGYVQDVNTWLDIWGFNVFWSGRSPALEAARVFTSNNPGRVVLEDTSKGIELTNITKEMDWIDAKPLWNNASAEFAENAVADFNAGKISHVDVFINDAHYSGSISVWESVEKPILVKNNIPIVEHHINVKCT